VILLLSMIVLWLMTDRVVLVLIIFLVGLLLRRNCIVKLPLGILMIFLLARIRLFLHMGRLDLARLIPCLVP
jgi:hypothetical protein